MTLNARRRLVCAAAAAVLCSPPGAQAGPFNELAGVLAVKAFQLMRNAAARVLGVDEAALATGAAREAEAAVATQQLRKALADADLGSARAEALDATQPGTRAPTAEGLLTHRLTPGRTSLLRSVQGLVGRLPKVVYADTGAKAFGQDFLRGARNSAALLHGLQSRHAALVDPWLGKPTDKRVFIIGASHDSRAIQQLRRDLHRDGFETYFFTDCRAHLDGLCGSDEVGAFFASAGHAVLVRSPAAVASGFIPVELASAGAVAGGGLLLVFGPDDVLHALANSAGHRTPDMVGSMVTAEPAPPAAPAVPVALYEVSGTGLHD